MRVRVQIVLAILLLIARPLHAGGQMQRKVVTPKGESHGRAAAHPLRWWTKNSLRLDESGDLLLGRNADGSHVVTEADYRIDQQVTTLGVLSGQAAEQP